MIDEMGLTCPCGRPVRYTSPCGKGSCNKYVRCKSYDELLEESKKTEKLLSTYRRFVNDIDDYFEYRFESKKDQRRVFQLLQNLKDDLVEIGND